MRRINHIPEHYGCRGEPPKTRKGVYLAGGSRLLPTKLVARETDHHKPFVLVPVQEKAKEEQKWGGRGEERESAREREKGRERERERRQREIEEECGFSPNTHTHARARGRPPPNPTHPNPTHPNPTRRTDGWLGTLVEAKGRAWYFL